MIYDIVNDQLDDFYIFKNTAFQERKGQRGLMFTCLPQPPCGKRREESRPASLCLLTALVMMAPEW